jgi:hypothetical protein
MRAYLVELLLALALGSQMVLGGAVPFFLDMYNNPTCMGPKAGTMVSPGLPAINKCIPTGSNAAAFVKGVPTTIASIRVNCPANTFSFGVSTTCSAKRFRLRDLCLANGPISYKVRCLPDVCRASAKMSEDKCNARIARCATYGYSMKW